MNHLKAYIPPERKIPGMGGWRWAVHPILLPNAKYTNMLVYFALADANFLRRPCTFYFLCVDFFALGSKRKPHFQWNIGCVGFLALGLCVGHVHFMG